MDKHVKVAVETDPLVSSVRTTTNSISRWLPESRTELQGLLWMCLAALLYPIPTAVVRLAFLSFDYPASASMILRSGTQLLFSLVLLMTIIRASPLDLSPQHQVVLFLRGMMGSIALVAFYKALTYVPAGEVVALFAVSPIATMLLAKVILKETTTLSDIICAVLGMVGVWLIVWPDSNPENMLGVLLIVLAILCASSAYVCVRGMGTDVHFMLCVLSFGAIAFPTTLFLGGQGAIDEIFTNHKGSGVVLVGCLAGFVAQCSVNRGLQLCKAGEGVIMMNLEVPTGYFLGMWLLDEQPSFVRVCGSMLVVSAVIVIGVQRLMQS